MSNNRKTFRQIRDTTNLARAAVDILLGLPNVTWSDNEYAIFFTMEQIQSGLENPSYKRVMTLCGAWLRLLKRLIDQLGNDEIRSKWQTQFAVLSSGYEELLKDETKLK